MKTAEELRDNLSEIFESLRAEKISPVIAAELANVAGKMINSAKVQVMYYALRKEAPNIAFLDSKDGAKYEQPISRSSFKNQRNVEST